MRVPARNCYLAALSVACLLTACYERKPTPVVEPSTGKSISGRYEDNGLDVFYQFCAGSSHSKHEASADRRYPAVLVLADQFNTSGVRLDLAKEHFSFVVDGREVIRQVDETGGLFWVNLSNKSAIKLEPEWPLEVLFDETLRAEFLRHIVRSHREQMEIAPAANGISRTER